jgi:osmotically-inducible protein OsmY
MEAVMFRGIIRLMLVAIVLVAAAFFFIGYWSGERFEASEVRAPRIDTTAAREAGAEIGEKAATVAARVSESMEEGSLTAKIKAKMVLDDLVKARTINVTTDGSTVVLSGTVHSPQERERSLALARETEGVTSVVDRLTVR